MCPSTCPRIMCMPRCGVVHTARAGCHDFVCAAAVPWYVSVCIHACRLNTQLTNRRPVPRPAAAADAAAPEPPRPRQALPLHATCTDAELLRPLSSHARNRDLNLAAAQSPPLKPAPADAPLGVPPQPDHRHITRRRRVAGGAPTDGHPVPRVGACLAGALVADLSIRLFVALAPRRGGAPPWGGLKYDATNCTTRKTLILQPPKP
jgi:hypothetical protein